METSTTIITEEDEPQKSGAIIGLAAAWAAILTVLCVVVIVLSYL